MNAQPDLPSQPITSENLHLTGWSLKLAWMIWIIVVLLVVMAISTAIPLFFQEALHGGPYTDFIVQHGISPRTFFPINFVFNTLQLSTWYFVAFFIVYRRRDDWLVLTASIMILANGYFVASFDQAIVLAYPTTLTVLMDNLTWFLDIANYGGSLLFFGSFPNGRFTSRWIKWIFICLIAYIIVEDLVIVIDPHILTYSIFSLFIRFVVLCAMLIFAQLYRLRHSSPIQRQQTKLVVIGLSLGVIGNVIDKLLVYQFGQIGYLIFHPLVFTLYICAAICFLYAILRYHLWGIDYVINRSMVYVGLTVLLGAIFGGGFFTLQFVLKASFGKQYDLIAISIPAVVITALFSPTRNRIRQFVDRRFYGIELDYKKVIEERTLRQKKTYSELDVRTSFGRYTNLDLIGRGGMGEVYRAYDTKMACQVSIKMLSKYLIQDDVAYKRYSHEAQAMTRLKHPNIVTLYDYGVMDEVPYIVLEYIQGNTLDVWLKQRGRLSLAEALPLFQQIASAIDHSHAVGIIHRDVKPSNVMIEQKDGEQEPRAILMDFGIAKLDNSMTHLTGTGVLIGTLDYVSPEQIQGTNVIDPRTDLYSFGVMVYQVLTGVLPFEHKNPASLMMAHLMQPAPDARTLVPELPKAVADAIIKAMAKEPNMRQSTAGEFILEMKGDRRSL